MPERLAKMKELSPVAPSAEILNEKATDIAMTEILSHETQWLVDEMFKVANGTQGDTKRRTMVGLAAPQLGISKRIIIVDVASTGMGETPDLRAYINPKIVERSDQTEQGREGCFSTGNVCGIVERSSNIGIEALDRDGNPLSENWDSFTARIFQHEIDHLDGIRFPERIKDDTKLHWVEPEQFGEYRVHWADWAELCPRATWEAVKVGKE